MEKVTTTLNERGFAVQSGYMNVYRAKEATNEYLGEVESFLVMGTGCAANEYPDQPEVEAKPGFCIVRSQSKDCWELSEDHRGEVCYDKETGQQVTISELGQIPSNLTDKAPSSKYDEWNEEKSAWVFNADKAAAEQEASVQAELSRRLKIVREQKVMLAEAVDGGWSDDPEHDKALLTEYKKCEYQLNKVSSQPGYPEHVEWPLMPGESPKEPEVKPEGKPSTLPAVDDEPTAGEAPETLPAKV
ncbi:MAG: tail fiber assembly protein [Aeromonas veronii]